MQKTHLLLLLTSLIFAFTTAQAGNKDKHEGSDVSLEEQPFVMPSYDQFRKMNDEKQAAYIQEVREMLGALTEKGVELSFFDRLNMNVTAKWTAFLSLMNQEASADNDNFCGSYSFFTGTNSNSQKTETCVRQNSDPSFVRCGSQAVAYKTNCPQKFADSAASQAEKVQAAKDNPAGGGAPAPAVKPGFESNSTADTSLDKKGKKFRCIYAGFTIYGDKCSPQTKYVDPKTNSVYTCAPTAGDKDYGVIAPAKIDAKKSILCNPVFFGTLAGASSNGSYAKQEPICVAKGKNATAECLAAANKNKDASLKSAVKFAKDDKAKYQELTDTVTKLCQPAGAFTPDSGLSASSKKDLESTCKQYRERMFDYAQAYGAATSSGVRAGPMATVPGAQ